MPAYARLYLLLTLTLSISSIWAEDLSTEIPKYASINASKVRMRSAPQLDAHIIKELSVDTPVEILGEEGDFFAIRPPSSMSAYVFRTFVLDDKIEGSRVNIRLEPHKKAPVIAQLNTGDTIKGKISHASKKWLELEIPEGVAFYIFKEYLDPISEERFLELSLLPVAEQAKETDTSILEEEPPLALNPRLEEWAHIEENLFKQWQSEHPEKSRDDFYHYTKSSCQVLEGMLEPYQNDIQNSPGDFLLISQGKPIAFVYSTDPKLAQKVNSRVKLKGYPRDNRHFAYPAFFIPKSE